MHIIIDKDAMLIFSCCNVHVFSMLVGVHQESSYLRAYRKMRFAQNLATGVHIVAVINDFSIVKYNVVKV